MQTTNLIRRKMMVRTIELWNVFPAVRVCGPYHRTASCSAKRHFSSENHQKEMSYIDRWFDSIVKTEDFYARHSEGKIRRYFYNVDLQGRLFLEETLPKNIATSIKDNKFLNFFFSRIRPVRDVDVEFLAEEGIEKDYPFVSLCGREVNFIRPAATPIVFHSMQGDDLHFGGDLAQTFQGGSLAISSRTGRLYHRVQREVRKDEPSSSNEYGLIRSTLAVTLAESIHPGDCDKTATGLCFSAKGVSTVIDELPIDSEPGDWAFPGTELE